MVSADKHRSAEIYCVSGRDDCARVEQRIHELEISEARYQNLFEAVTDALISVDRDGLVNRANSSCEQVFGWSASELLGKPMTSLFKAYPQVVQTFLKTLQGDGQDLELPFAWASGHQVILALRLSAITDGEGVSGALIVARDLSKEKARELERMQLYENLLASHREQKEKAQALEVSRQQLQEAMAQQEKVNAELREIDRMKSDFIGLASHELTTPLTFLLGALEFLEESLPGRINEDEQSLLDYAMQGSQRLADIVENMLDIVRLDADGFHPQRESVSIFPLLTHVRSNIDKVLKERKLTLHFGENPDWPDLLVDPGLLRRALEDLIGNAIKYTEAGGEIRVSGQVRSRQSLDTDAEQIRLFNPDFPESVSWDGDFFEVCVADNGIGIPQHELSHVFERFYTVGNLDDHSSGDKFLGRGAGLGLALVKRIVSGHSGLSWAFSPGSSEETGLDKPGSCFHLLLPYESLFSPLEAKPRVENKARLLVIDDEPAIHRFIDVLLNNGYDLELALSGADGLAKARTFAPDLILIDLAMPDMDGFEVCKQLKADPQTTDIPLVFLTALSDKHEMERGKEAGAVAYLTKPFFPRELVQRIEQLLQEHCQDKNSRKND